MDKDKAMTTESGKTLPLLSLRNLVLFPGAVMPVEIGRASSLKLIEIHEQIDRVYPGKVDLTELFDFPTIADLSRHLEGKLAATV